MTSEFLIVAEQILENEKRPMSPKEIVAIAIRQKIFSDKRSGKTPHQTMKSKLSVDIRKKGDKSIFVRTKPGVFYLRYLLSESDTPYVAPPFTKPKAAEDILVFNSSWLNDKRRFQGIKKNWKRLKTQLVSVSNCLYMDRIKAEAIVTHKQILTYVLVTRKGDVLAYKRGNYNRVEDFLRGADCIGFGGHVSSADNDLFSVGDMGIEKCVTRELSEELSLPDVDVQRLRDGVGLSCIGILNDDSSIVGQRHMAFLFNYEVSDHPAWDDPKRGEKSITQLRWLSKDLKVHIWNFEYWSQLCLREYHKSNIKTKSAYRLRRVKPLKSPNIICIIGSVGCGKSEATKILCNEYGYQEINTGRLVADILKIPPIPITTREEFQTKAWKFISSPDGPNKLANKIKDEAIKINSDKILIDGIRQKETLNILNKLLKDIAVGIIYVHTSPDLAFKFYADREKNNCTVFDFLKVRNSAVEKEMEETISMADAILYNWAGISEYKQTIRSLMKNIGK